MLAHFPTLEGMRICDVGGSRHFWDKLQLNISPGNVVIFNVDEAETERVDGRRDGIEVKLYDGARLPVEDHAFDLVVCNSVIEHVHPNDHESFSAELQRVGKRLFLQTPCYWFPIEPHFLCPFIHWLPRPVGYLLAHASPWRLLSRPRPDVIESYWWGTELLTPKQVKKLFPSGRIEFEAVLGLPKSIYVIVGSEQ